MATTAACSGCSTSRGTRMAAAAVPMRTLQEWFGHRDLRTTHTYADYAPGEHELDLVNGAFSNTEPTRRRSTNLGTNLREIRPNSVELRTQNL